MDEFLGQLELDIRQGYPGHVRVEFIEEMLDSLLDDPRFCETASAELLNAVRLALQGLEEAAQATWVRENG